MKISETIEKEYADIASTTNSEIKVTKNEAVENILAIWKQTKIYADYKKPEPEYQSIIFPDGRIGIEKAAKCTAEDIASFCILADGTDKEIQSLGFFLSSIINEHQKQTGFSGEYVLPIHQKNARIDGIGFQNNGASIKVIGSVGYYTGKHMAAGIITLVGDAFAIGEGMYGGNIHILGSTDNVGKDMRGGVIHITECAALVGENMKNGKITVEKNCFYAGESMKSGHIIIKGNVERAGYMMENGIIEIFGNCKNGSWHTTKGKIKIYEKCKNIV